MSLDVMVDLETMGIVPESAIVSIGAVKFDPKGEPGTTVGDPYYMAIDLQSCLDAGLKVTGHTVMWWMQQSSQARERLSPSVPLLNALNEFTIWFGGESLSTWGNGAAFDCVVLRNAYRAMDIYPPFKYTDERCYRTLRKVLPEVPYLPPVLAHDALEDARAQAAHLQLLMQKTPLNRRG